MLINFSHVPGKGLVQGRHQSSDSKAVSQIKHENILVTFITKNGLFGIKPNEIDNYFVIAL